MAEATFNKNELILDRVRSMSAHDLSTGKMLYRLTSLEDPTLSCTAEGEEVTDAVGALITTLYRSKRATFSATNSLVSLDLLAAQYGTEKVKATSDAKILDYTYEILEVDKSKHTLTLAHTPKNDIKHIYEIKDGEIGKEYSLAPSEPPSGQYSVSGNTVTFNAEVVSGKFYVEYDYESEEANEIVNMADKVPEACSVIIYAYFRDKCNENIVYSGKIICPKAKLNAESMDLNLTSTGKHPFEFTMMKDYCSEDGELFRIIVAK